MRALKFITGHVIFKLRYNQIYQLKTTKTSLLQDFITMNCVTFTSFFSECKHH